MTTKQTTETVIEKIGASYQRWRANEQAIEAAIGDRTEAVMALALDLLALKQATKSNNAFGAALDTAGYSDKNGPNYLSDKNRAALLNFAKHPEQARTVLDKTDRTNLHNIWVNDLKPIVEPDSEPKSSSPRDEHDKAKAANAADEGSKVDSRQDRYSAAEVTLIEKHAFALLAALTRNDELTIESDELDKCILHYVRKQEASALVWYALRELTDTIEKHGEDATHRQMRHAQELKAQQGKYAAEQARDRATINVADPH